MGCASSSPSYPSVPGHSVTKTGSKMAKIVKATGPHHLSLDIQARFIANDSSGMIQAEYVWIGGNNELRCKTKVPRPPLSAHAACPLSRLTYHDVPVACTQTLTKAPSSPEDLPVWNFDGSSTEQAPGSDSEVLLVPCAIYSVRDPSPVSDEDGSSPHILVLCDCYKPDPDAPKGVGKAAPALTYDFWRPPSRMTTPTNWRDDTSDDSSDDASDDDGGAADHTDEGGNEFDIAWAMRSNRPTP